MKNLIQKNNLKNVFCMFMFAVMMIACSNAQNNQHKNSPELCGNVKTTVQNEIGGKISENSTIVFFPAKDKNEAFKQAQSLAIKMNAEFVRKEGATYIYALHEENANIQIIEKENDECLFVILYLLINCEDYPVKEIHYMRSKCYNKL